MHPSEPLNEPTPVTDAAAEQTPNAPTINDDAMPDEPAPTACGTVTKHTSGPLLKAGDDEPIFVLRAQDRFSGPITRLWAALCEAAGVEEGKVAEARRIADELDAWPRKKLPD